MKRFFLLFFVLIVLPLGSNAQYVTIPDPNFASYLQTYYPNCMNGNQMDTTCTDITNLLALSISSPSVQVPVLNLDGIEYFDSLKLLYVNNIGLQELHQLPAGVEHVEITDVLDSLGPLPAGIDKLIMSDVQLTYLPELPLGITQFSIHNAPNVILPDTIPASMELFHFPWCNQTEIPVLPPGLNSLYIENNPVTNLPPLPPALEYLYFAWTNITTIPPLPSGLKILRCTGTNVSGLPTLPPTISDLAIGGTLITSIPALPDTMGSINAYGANLTHITNFPLHMTGQLELSENMLTSLPPLPNYVYWFKAANNQLLCLPTIPSSVSSLDLQGNLFTCVPNMTATMANFPYLNSLPICSPGYVCPNSVEIHGHVDFDDNGNCISDVADTEIGNVVFKLYDNVGNLLTTTSSSYLGDYFFNTGYFPSHTVEMDTVNKPYSVTCSGSDSTFSLNPTVDTIINDVDFLVNCKPGFDIGVQSVTTDGWVFPGQIHTVTMGIGDISNWYASGLNCAAGINGTVTAIVSGKVTNISPAAGALVPVVTNDTVLTYTITDFSTLDFQNDFKIVVECDTTVQSGDVFFIDIAADPVSGDNNPANNTMVFGYTAVNSYDPNEKNVYPESVLPGYDDWITYTIHFQNTGTAPAFNIRLEDTLSHLLDLSTFEVLGAKHNFHYSLTGNRLVIHFPDIMLPDSTSNEPGSKGYFQYRIKPAQGYAEGYEIENKAYIFFDFNAPIITNTAITKYEITGTNPPAGSAQVANYSSVDIVVYPNPNQGTFYIKCDKEFTDYTVKLYSLSGRELPVGTSASQGMIKVELENYLKGVVFMVFESEYGVIRTKLLLD